MTALDPGFHAVDSVFQVHNSRYFVTATWIPDSQAQDSRFHYYKFPGFRIPQAKLARIPYYPYYLKWEDK